MDDGLSAKATRLPTPLGLPRRACERGLPEPLRNHGTGVLASAPTCVGVGRSSRGPLDERGRLLVQRTVCNRQHANRKSVCGSKPDCVLSERGRANSATDNRPTGDGKSGPALELWLYRASSVSAGIFDNFYQESKGAFGARLGMHEENGSSP